MQPGIQDFGTTIWMNRKPILETIVTPKIYFPNTQFTWPILISQHKLELFMADALEKYGFKVDRNIAARDITQASSTTIIDIKDLQLMNTGSRWSERCGRK